MTTKSKANIKKAAALIRQGKVIVLPTETVYGLGADPANQEALEQVYKMKGRDWRKQLPLAVKDISWLDRWGLKLNRQQKNVLGAFWPGPLTLVVRAVGGLTDLAAIREETVALRCPDHPLLLKLLQLLDHPLALTSANCSGKKAPTQLAEVEKDILEGVELAVDGGPCWVAEASSVVSMVDGVEVLREGPVSQEDVERAIRGKARRNSEL